MVKLEKANVSDLEVYSGILQKELDFSPSEAIRYLKRSKPKNILKIEINKKQVGFVNLSQRGKVFYIKDLDIIPEYRNKGYGSKLLLALEKEAKNRKVKRIWLHVNVSNKKAIRLYTKNKYIKERIIKKFYQNKFDACVLNKNLKTHK